MDKADVQKALEEIKKQPKRNFTQSYDLIINLKNVTAAQSALDFFVNLHHPKGDKVKIAAFVDQQLAEQANKFCDLTIKETEFLNYKDQKKELKKLAEEYDYFIAQSNLMPKIAAVFGRVLGTKGKMPNPKLGCVIPPNANLEPLIKKLSVTVRLAAKKGNNLQLKVGRENQPEEQIIENILAVYQATLKQLPNEMQNIKNVTLKLTMGKPVKI